MLRVEDSKDPDADGAVRWGPKLFQEIWIADVAPPDRVRLDLDLTEGVVGHGPGACRQGTGAPSGRGLPGTVVVGLLSRESLVDLIGCMREWAARIGRTVQIVLDGDTLAVTGATDEEQETAVRTFLGRHVGAGD